METIYSFQKRLFARYDEPRVKDYLFLDLNWWQIATVIIVYNSLALLGPWLMRNHKPYDLRPWLLVYSGLQFGVNGVALPVMLILTNFTQSAWQCAKPKYHPIIEETFIRLGYAYLWLKIVDILTTVFMVLRKKPQQSAIRHSLRNSTLALSAFIGLTQYPKGFFIIMPMFDCIFTTLRSSYYVMAAPGAAFKHLLGFKRYIDWTAFIVAISSIIHVLRHIMFACDGPLPLMLITLTHNLIETVLAYQNIVNYSLSNTLKAD